MTQQEKELLLKDISARLLYGIKVKRKSKQFGEDIVLVDMDNFSYFLEPTDYEHETIQLCRRPMSSMSEEEKEHCAYLLLHMEDWLSYYDYLNSRYLDYRGLIEKDLALEAPEDMYRNK
jgi:hypothetical protein